MHWVAILIGGSLIAWTIFEELAPLIGEKPKPPDFKPKDRYLPAERARNDTNAAREPLIDEKRPKATVLPESRFWDIVAELVRDDPRGWVALMALSDSHPETAEDLRSWGLSGEEIGMLFSWLSTKPGHGNYIEVRDEIADVARRRDAVVLATAKASVPSAAAWKTEQDAAEAVSREKKEARLKKLARGS